MRISSSCRVDGKYTLIYSKKHRSDDKSMINYPTEIGTTPLSTTTTPVKKIKKKN